MPENAPEQSSEVNETSVRYAVSNVRKLMIEVELFRREHAGLTELANSLSEFHQITLPLENARLSDDDLYYKWIEQIARYRAMAKGVQDIAESRREDLSKQIDIAGDLLKRFPRPLPEDLQQDFEEITKMSEEFKKINE